MQRKLEHIFETTNDPLISYRCSLQSVRDAISNQVSGASLLYEQNIDTLATCTQRSAVAPSIADMLEWLQDAGCYYRQQYPFCVIVLLYHY